MRSSLETCTGLKMMSQDAVLLLSTLQLVSFTLTDSVRPVNALGTFTHICHLMVSMWVLQHDPC